MNQQIRKRITTLSLLFACVAFVFAQTAGVTVKGVVVDKSNEPLIGATVSVKGTSVGTMTDIDGQFSIEVPTGKEIDVTYVGFSPQAFVISKATTLKVTLEEDSKLLKDVVVFGYGTMQKKDLTGSINTLDNSELMKSLATNVTEALNGRVSGIVVSKDSNRPGADMKIQIRGQNSINFSNEPLYVIDGVTSQSGMRHLNSADIESIDILKDASSSAIYGSRGANGVIIITTKGANKKEGFSIDYNGSFGVKTATRIPDMIGNKGNGLEYVDYRTKLWKKKYGDASLGRPDFLTEDEKRRVKYGEYYDWIREVAQNSIVTNHSVSASGNSDKVSYTFGVGYLKDEGLVGNENFDRITANLGLEYKMDKNLKMGMNSYVSFNKTNLGSNEALLNAYFIPPIASPYGHDGNYVFEVQPTSSKINPFMQIDNQKNEKEARYTNVAGFVEYLPIKDLALKSQFAVQYDNDINGEWVGTYTQGKQGANLPDAFRKEGTNLNYVWDNTATYNKTFNEVHKFNAIGLFSAQKETHKGSQMRGIGMPYESDWHAIQTADQLKDVESYYWESSMLSVMARLNYIYNDKYLFTATGRYDGSSRLVSGNQWGFMPSFSTGWRISEENFMKDVDWLSNLKLRIGWGKSGNNNLEYHSAISKLSQSRYIYGGSGSNGFGIDKIKGNPKLKWEMTSEWNFGLDLGLLNNRIDATIDIYDRTTSDLIMRRSVSSVNGYDEILENIGKVGNRGVEIGVNSTNIKTSDFSWTTNATFSLNRNRIIDLDGRKQDDLGNRRFIGQAMNIIYDFEMLGIWQEDERAEAAKYGQLPGHIKVNDVDNNGVLDERDYKVLGRRSPDWTVGMTNTFNYKEWDLSFYMYSRYGGLYDDSFTYTFTAWDNEHWNKLDVNYWTPENGSNEYPEIGAQSYYTQVLGKVSGTFLKVQNITLGYTLKENTLKSLRLKHARVYGTVQNPFTFTSYKGTDPETVGEKLDTQLSLYPMTFSLGVNVSF